LNKPVRLRSRAAGDIDSAVDFYVAEAGADVAGRFVDAVERSVRQLGRQPHGGSLRFAFELDIPGLRAFPVSRFPYLVFYVERETELDVWRLLHTSRDIPTTLVETDEG
jgi:toxin ParE1/3/4